MLGHLEILPPCEKLGPAEAIAWLERARGYMCLICDCLGAPDDATREAAKWLAMDVGTMMEACAEVLRSGQAREVLSADSFEPELGSVSYTGVPLILAAAMEDTEGHTDATVACLVALARELGRRLAGPEAVERAGGRA